MEGVNGGKSWWEMKNRGENGGETAGRWASTSPCLVVVIPASTGMPYSGPMPPMMLQPTGAVMVC